jgi:O-antigen ligase
MSAWPLTIRLAQLALPLLLAGLTVVLGFDAGGYFASTTGWATAGLALALAAVALAAGRPPHGVTWPLVWAAGALALLGIWILLSATWSEAPARALFELDRVLLYLLTLLLFATAPFPKRSLRRLPVAFAAAALVLCAAGVLVRTLPEQWPFSLPPDTKRMAWPVTYENALGALAALGLVFTLHVAAWREERGIVRVLAAGALPVLAAALVLTFSRGATVASVIGLLAYLVWGRSPGVVTALAASAASVLVAVQAAYDADLLATATPRAPAAVDQGEEVAIVLAACVAGAAVLMALLLPVERRLARRRLPSPGPYARRVIAAAGLAAAVGLAGAVVASGAAGDLYERSIERPSEDQPTRERLTEPRGVTHLGAQSRPKYWRVSIDAFEEDPLKGTGSGTFGQRWDRDRAIVEDSTEGHSIYVETLGELGAVGGLLVLAVLGTAAWPFAAGLRGPMRPLYAALLAGTLAWLIHAGLDWDWEMPVLTLWLFAASGCALAASPRRPPWAEGPSVLVRGLVAGGLVIIALTPAAIALSQTQLNESLRALRRGDCGAAERAARDSIDVLSVRAEPYAILAYCKARRGRHDEAMAAMLVAIDREPGNWEYHYGLALVSAAARRDPRPAARKAHELNPLERLTNDALERFDTDSPGAWRRRSRSAPLPLRPRDRDEP